MELTQHSHVEPFSSRSICLVVLVGLPASGKSTLSKKIMQETGTNGETVAISLSYDDFVPHEIQAKLALLSVAASTISQNDNNETLTRTCRRKFIECVKSVIVAIQQNTSNSSTLHPLISGIINPDLEDILPNSHFVEKTCQILAEFEDKTSSVLLIIDDNHYYSSMREELFSVGKKFQLGFCIIYCKASVDVCIERNLRRQTHSQVPAETIVEMGMKLEPPNSDGSNGGCDAFCIQVVTDRGNDVVDMPLILDMIASAMKHPVKLEKPCCRLDEVERERKICSQNEVHQADQILRKWVNRNMVKVSQGHNKAEVAKVLNKKRVLLLEQLKDGSVRMDVKVDQGVQFSEEVVKLVESMRLD